MRKKEELEKMLNGFLKTTKRQLHTNLKTLAIIGGDGMVGSDLIKYLNSDFSVTSITKKNYSEFISKSFDVLVNANGNSKRFWANKNVLEDFNLSTVSVYKSIFDFRYTIYIYISSSDVYKNHSSPLTTVESIIYGEGLSAYGLHKYLRDRKSTRLNS